MFKIFDTLLAKFKSLSRISRVTIVVVFFLGFIGMFLQAIFPDIPPAVHSIYPETEFGISEIANFEVTFARVLDESTKRKLSLRITPEVESKNFWSENNYQYYINTTEKLQLDTEYVVNVYYKNKKIYSKTYLTSKYSFEEQAEHAREQTQADIEFNKAISNLQKDFPWYNDIPIDNDQFTIVYDYDQTKFRIRLKIPENTDPEIIDNLTNKALAKMEELDINPSEWGYYILFIK